jgi:CO/xanthine dehydrogenase Mo-binding subunit
MDTIAETLGMDPLELRLKNILEDYSTLPTGQVLEKVTLRETIQRAVEIMGWKRDGDWL